MKDYTIYLEMEVSPNKYINVGKVINFHAKPDFIENPDGLVVSIEIEVLDKRVIEILIGCGKIHCVGEERLIVFGGSCNTIKNNIRIVSNNNTMFYILELRCVTSLDYKTIKDGDIIALEFVKMITL